MSVRYFVSYFKQDKKGIALGRAEVVVEKNIENMEHVENMEEFIKEKDRKDGIETTSLTILNIQKFPIK